MPPSADEIKARVCAELEYWGDDWLNVACLRLQAHGNQRRRAKLYDTSTIGGRLRCARECAGMRQKELARRVGMAQWHISGMERELRPLPAVKVPGICMSLGIKIIWLLSGEGPGPQAVYGILRKDQSPRAARETAKAKRREVAMVEVRRRQRERHQAILTSKAVPVHVCPTTEPLKTTAASKKPRSLT